MRTPMIVMTLGLALSAGAQAPERSATFTVEQAARGRTLYARHCASCHGQQLVGGTAAPLTGRDFQAKWVGRSVADLLQLTRTMPYGEGGTLTNDEYVDLVAFTLEQNGHRAGSEALVADASVLGAVKVLATAPPPARPAQRPAPEFVVGPKGLEPTTSVPTRSTLAGAARDGRDWLTHTRDYAGTRYSPLTQITTANASRLRVACSFQVGDNQPFQTGPVVHDGTLYLTTTWSTIAIDAATCRPKWRHDWQNTTPGVSLANRGVAISEGRLIRVTADGYLLAIDAATGTLLWARRVSDASRGEWMSLPPLIHDDLVYAGIAVSEFAIRGWVSAFKVSNGERVWKFNIVPAPGEPGSETWKQDAKIPLGGGAVWTPMSFDTESGTLFVSAANPAPDFPVALRGGTNLYTNSILALDGKTGALRWYDQIVPLDDHDWDLTQVSPLYSARAGGKLRRLVATAGKDGRLRVLDRDTRERIFTAAVTTIENDTAAVTVEGTRACPGMFGGVQWNGPTYHPGTNLLVTPAVDWCATFSLDEDVKFQPLTLYMGGEARQDTLSRGWITAVDASTGVVRWRYASKRPVIGAVTSTAGGVIMAGEGTGDFVVLDAATGVVRYRHFTGGQVGGGVVTYSAGGTQYVAVASGSASRFFREPFPGSATITVFSLPGR